MKHFNMLTNTLFAIGCALLLGGKSFAEPMNIGQLVTELQTYQRSGEYDHEFSAVIAQAETFITNKVNSNKQSDHPQKLALVLDIDDTSLSNYDHLAARHFCINRDQFNNDILQANDPVLAPTLALYQAALKQGVAVFFITGRPDSLHKATVKNLKTAGYTDWAGIYYRPKTDTVTSVIPYKTQARGAITAAGYTILASIGDQQSDLAGNNIGEAFKVPNPFYFLP